MKAIYSYGCKWFVYTETKPSFSFNKPGVYIIRIKNELTNRSKVVYVGTSGSLSMRAYRHPVIIELNELMPSHFAIHFLFKEQMHGREKTEKLFIEKLKPCFNKTVFGLRKNYKEAYKKLDQKKANLFN